MYVTYIWSIKFTPLRKYWHCVCVSIFNRDKMRYCKKRNVINLLCTCRYVRIQLLFIHTSACILYLQTVSYPVQSLPTVFFFIIIWPSFGHWRIYALHNKYNNISIYYNLLHWTQYSLRIFFLFCCCFVLINESKYCFNHLKRLTAKNDLLLLLYYYYYYRCAFSRHCYYRFTFSWLEQMSISRWCANWRKHTYITIIIIHVYIIIYTCCPCRIE